MSQADATRPQRFGAVEEAIGLARAISLDVVSPRRYRCARSRRDPHRQGGGRAIAKAVEAGRRLVIVDDRLTPVQQRTWKRPGRPK